MHLKFEHNANMIIRFSPPTLEDTLPYGTICYELINEDNQKVYKQISQDQLNPHWQQLCTLKDNMYGIAVSIR